jgi:hypothetical protein
MPQQTKRPEMTLKSVLTFALLLNFLSLSAQGKYTRTLENYRLNYLPEKVFVHTDKAIYAAGETIWAAVYLVDGQTHEPDSISKTIHLELHDPGDKVVQRRKLYTYDGHTAGDLMLPASLKPGDYQLTAYTNYQRNTGAQSLFRKTIRIVSGLKESGGLATPALDLASESTKTDQNFNLRFFPEGGDCIIGIPCRVAVVAENKTGTPVPISGYLADETGKAISFFATTENGAGTINYTPGAGQKVSVFAGPDKQEFDLPEPLPEGLHLSVQSREDTVRVQLSTLLAGGLGGATLLLHLRGISVFEQQLKGTLQDAAFLFPEDQLPPGVVTATLFDAGGQPVAERLFFVAPPRTKLEINLKKEQVPPRGPVELTLKMPMEGVPDDSLARGRVSLSVIPVASAGGPTADDIRTWLLLNSDLDRPVPAAAELLYATSAKERNRKIEGYLLTREWRRFRWEELLDQPGYTPRYRLEEGIYLDGRMTKIDSKDSPRPGKIFLTRLENGYLEETFTDEEGYFTFGPYQVFDTLKVAVQGRFKRGKNNWKDSSVSLDDNNMLSLEVSAPEGATLPPVPAYESPEATATTNSDTYAELSRKSLTVARNYDSLVVDLQTIDVVSKRIDKVEESRRERTILYGSPDNRIIADSIPGSYAFFSVLDFLQRAPGVVVVGTGLQASVRIRGIGSIQLSSEPLYLIDGLTVPLESIVTLPVQFIDFIDVLRGVSAASFGSRGASGVIAVYTRTGNGGTYKEPGLLNASLNGYHKVRQFAVFDSDLPGNRNRPDLRTTLHWNPELRMGAKGIVRERFPASDQTGKFLIVAQGLRADGTPFFGLGEFFVVE